MKHKIELRPYTNPFWDSYFQQEMEYMAGRRIEGEGVINKVGDVTVEAVEMFGRVDDYLNMNFRTGGMILRLRIGNATWMSITPMEVQSHWVPIQRARYSVGVGGLGLGYAALRMAQKKDVTTVDVFEEDKDVIKMFEELYGEREEVEKIKIHEMDVRDLKGDTFHFFYMDIYPTMLEEEMLDDVEFFCDRNYVQEYRYWTQEKLLIAGLIEAPIRGLNKMLTEEDRELIQYWHQAKTGGTKLSQLYQRLGDNERIEGMLLKHKELNL